MKFGLHNIDSEDLTDILSIIEASFHIKFDEDSSEIRTLGGLCDYIIAKLNSEEVNYCTSQQAFYKLRLAILKYTSIAKDKVVPGTMLKEIFPYSNRRSIVQLVEKELGHKIYLLRPPYWVTTTLFILFLFSLVGIIIKWQAGLLGLVISLAGFVIAAKFGKCLTMATFKELTLKTTTFHYAESRRNTQTINKVEIETVIINIFEDCIGPFEPKLSRESTFA